MPSASARTTLFAVGISHHEAATSLRERFALDERARQSLLESAGAPAELLLLSTCNRVEAYLYGTRAELLDVRRRLSEIAGVPWPDEVAFELAGGDAVQRLMRVTSGLESLVTGDSHVLAQVKAAYREAVMAGRAGAVMHRLMHTAFRSAKRVINETTLLEGAASVPRAALCFAQRHFEADGGIAGKKALVVGLGTMGRLALSALKGLGPSEIVLINRSADRTSEAAERFGACCRPWEERHEAVMEADLVIVATAASEPVIRAEALRPRGNGALLVDLSVPRNVDLQIEGMPGFSLVDLDLLDRWLRLQPNSGTEDLQNAGRITDEMTTEFLSWYREREALQPAIETLIGTFEEIRSKEVDRHSHRFAPDDREELDRITRSIVNKILAIPIVRLKDADSDLGARVRLLQTLFEPPRDEKCLLSWSPPVIDEASLQPALREAV